jgi:hypothetical protein
VAAFLANVGVNAAHAAHSRLNVDGSFAVLPIPERAAAKRPMRTLGDPDLADLAALAPPTWRTKAVHLDPDFRSDTPTYGDNCRTAGRAFNLRRALPGDTIWFAARLHGEDGAGLHLVGRLEIAEVLRDVVEDPGPGWWDRNAHVLRGRATGQWNSFWVFRGTAGSGWLPAAPRLTKPLLEQLFGAWEWPAGATEQQVIAWHTRAVRRIA